MSIIERMVEKLEEQSTRSVKPKSDALASDRKKRPLRRFRRPYKLYVLSEADKCADAMDLQALLGREGLTLQQLSKWRKQLKHGLGSPEHPPPASEEIPSGSLGSPRARAQGDDTPSGGAVSAGHAQPLARSDEVPSREPGKRDWVAYAPTNIGGSGTLQTVSTADLLRVVRRRKWLIVAMAVIAAVASSLAVLTLTPQYTTSARLMIAGHAEDSTGVGSAAWELPGDPATIVSEAEVLRSRELVGTVVEQLGLDKLPEFNVALQPRGPLAALKDALFKPAELSEEDRLAGERVRVVDEFLRRLEVKAVGSSRVISLGFGSADPELAALAANTLAERYILDQREAKLASTKGTSEWLNEQVAELRAKLDGAETEVEKFRQASELLRGKDATLLQQEISALNEQLVLAGTQRAEAEARLRQARGVVDAPTELESVTEVLQSRLIERLREQESDLDRQIAQASETLSPNHPERIQLQAAKQELRGKIRAEVKKIANSLENETNIARSRELSLQKNLDDLKTRVGQSNQDAVKLSALEREADTARQRLEELMSRFQETSAQQDLDSQRADARVISRAEVPTVPSFPRKIPTIPVAVVLGVFLGLGFAFAAESLKRGFLSGEEIESRTGLPLLALIPSVSWFARRGRSLRTLITKYPTFSYCESLRSLYTHIRLLHGGVLPKKIMVTSATAGEGKSSIADGMAELLAMAGQRAVVVHADLRKPRPANDLEIPRAPGLSEYLNGKAALEQILHQHPKSGAHVIPAGTAKCLSIPDLLDSALMQDLLAALSRQFDVVILDTPPVRAASDACSLATKADMTVFVVRWERTPQEVACHSLEQILRQGAKTAIALSRVDVNKLATYGYADSGYYTGAMKNYYAR